MIWHLHFHILYFFLLSVLLPKQAISFNIWQKHDKQSISSEHEPMQPTQSHDALCQLLLCTGTNTLSELLKHFSNALLSGLQKCIYSQRWKKVLSRDVKEVDEGRICYLWQCIILADGAPVTFNLCTMDTAQDDRKPCLQSGLQSSKESQLCNSVTGFHLHLSVNVSELNVGLCCAVMLREMGQCSHPGRPKYLSALLVVCSSEAIITDFKSTCVSSFIIFEK